MSFKRPRLFIFILTLAVFGLTLKLGFWQLARGDRKAELAQKLVIQSQYKSKLWRGELGDLVWFRRFLVEGEWQAQDQIFLDNRMHNGRAGFYVLAPLKLPDGQYLLVNRGWVPKQAEMLPKANLPTGHVQLLVRLHAPAQHYLELAKDDGPGNVWQNLDWARYGKRVKAHLVPAIAYQLEGNDPMLRDWPAPDVGVEKHYAYAGQWFLLSGLSVVLFVIFHWKRKG